MKRRPIGIIDSGIGGFSVAKSIRQSLPQEDIIYLGDGANAPYGNRTAQELTALASYMVEFMNQQEVKLLLVACNTISCLASTYEHNIQSPVLYVVKAGAQGVATQSYRKVGVISTNFTHQKGMYSQYIQEINPNMEVLSAGSTHLVRLIEENTGDRASTLAMEEELNSVISPLVEKGIECCVLGCTHYPLASGQLAHCFPNLPFSDPAEEMARQARELLSSQQLLSDCGGSLTVYTTGETSLQEAHLKRANLFPVTDILHHKPLSL